MSKEMAVKLVARYNALKEWFSSMLCVSDEAQIIFTREGMDTKIVDTAHVMMVESHMSSSSFDSYKPPKKKKEIIGINIDTMLHTMGKPIDTDIVTMEINDDLTIMTLIVDGVENEIALPEPDTMSNPKVPSLKLPIWASLSTDKLRRIIRESGHISDHVIFVAKEKELTIMAVGESLKKKYRFQVDSLNMPDKTGESGKVEAMSSMYPLDYTDNIMKAIKGQWTTINMGQDYPIKFIAEQRYGVAKTEYLLAPRVEAEDDGTINSTLEIFQKKFTHRSGRTALQSQADEEDK